MKYTCIIYPARTKTSKYFCKQTVCPQAMELAVGCFCFPLWRKRLFSVALVMPDWNLILPYWARNFTNQNIQDLSVDRVVILLVHFKMLKKGGSDAASKAKKSSSTFDASNGVKHRGNAAARISESETAVITRKKRDTFSHSIYEKAAEIYRHLKGEIPSSQLPTFEDDLERRRAYSVAFGAKRCKLNSHCQLL